jgi:hypothetical protein
MPVWYEVEHSKKGIHNFMECNWHFHDFTIERVNYLSDSHTVELFLKYDELEDSIILRFIDVHSMNINIQVDMGYISDIMGSVLLLLKNGHFLWIDDDQWGDQSINHIDELKRESSWIQAERLIWATTDSNGDPTELPTHKIDQTWNIYGKIEHHHFDLTPLDEAKYL